MKRRSFIKGLIACAVAPHFLPGAGRIWKAERPPLLVNPKWVKANYEVQFIWSHHIWSPLSIAALPSPLVYRREAGIAEAWLAGEAEES